jgi:RNA polymerase sigma factor (TIGR02999 family)
LNEALPPATDVTALLKAWRAGDADALERLTPVVYGHLRQLGRHYLQRERAGGDATSLVHEAFIRLVDARGIDWRDRAHFLAVCARIMRRLLVDAARARNAGKRGGGWQRIDHEAAEDLDRLPSPGTERAREVCALDDSLERLAQREPRRAQIVELRFFGGLSVEETAAALGVSEQTVMRDWKLARAWLALELRQTGIDQ